LGSVIEPEGSTGALATTTGVASAPEAPRFRNAPVRLVMTPLERLVEGHSRSFL
jgi:hypothetical protein